MKLHKVLIGLALFVISVIGNTQDNKTLNTSIPIYESESEWKWVFNDTGKQDYYMNTKHLNLKSNEITIWIRVYNYKHKSISVEQWSTKMRERQTAVTNVYLYDMDSGENLNKKNVNSIKNWAPIIPGSTADALFDYISAIR